MGILYLIVILIFGLYSYARYKHFAIIKAVNKCARSTDYIPVLASGRTVKAFTIEKTEMIYASRTISVDFISYFISRIRRLFGFGEADIFKLYGDYARSLCYGQLKKLSAGANYIINTHESVKRISPRKINVFIYGNAIYRYADTLPIFTMNIRKIGESKPVPKGPMFKMLSSAFMQVVVAMVLIKLASVGLSNYLVNHFSLKDERVLWSYVDNVAIGERIDSVELLKAESELQGLLDSIPKEKLGNKYQFFVHVYNDESVNISLYPAGHIVMTRGFVERLKYKNQALFALAHMVEHYNNGDHISAIHDKIVNLKIIASVFGEDSFIGKLLVWRSDFDRNYTTQQEIKADEFALGVLNERFGRSGGSDIFEEDFYNITNAYIKLFSTHPFSSERSDAVSNYIAEHKLAQGNEEPLAYVIEDISVPSKITAGELSINDHFMNLFSKYREDMNKQYAEYQAFLSPFNNILQLGQKLTIPELNRKKQMLDRGSLEIAKYNADFNSIINYHDKKINELIQTQEDPGQKRVLGSLWQKEKSSVQLLVNFYMERDRQILETQSIIVQFLTTRFGSYTITKHGIEFQTNKEKADYKVLQRRIEEILKKAPPNTTSNK